MPQLKPLQWLILMLTWTILLTFTLIQLDSLKKKESTKTPQPLKSIKMKKEW